LSTTPNDPQPVVARNADHHEDCMNPVAAFDSRKPSQTFHRSPSSRVGDVA
jgi:hypothetical protein